MSTSRSCVSGNGYPSSIPISSHRCVSTRPLMSERRSSSSTPNSRAPRRTWKSPRRWPMPKAKRAPIDYTPQFGAGIFRSKETIEQELAELADGVATDAGETANEVGPEDGIEVAADPDEGSDGK